MANSSTSMPSASPAEKPTRQRFVLAGILLFTLLVAYLDRVNVSVLIADNTFLTDMGIVGNPVQMGMLMTLFLIPYGLANVFLSPLGDIYGPRKAMSLSIFMWIIAVFIGGFAATFTIMLAARVLLGLGEGLHWPMQSRYVKNWFPPRDRAKANSLWLLGLMLGPALAMPFFTWVVKSFGWRPSFFVLVFLGMLPVLLIWFYTTDNPFSNKHVNKQERDLIASGLKDELQKEQMQGKASVWDGMKTFISNYRFWLLVVWYCCQASMFYGTMAWLPSYLKVARGFSWGAMGSWASLPYILGAFSLLLIGWLSDKVGRRAPFCAVGHIGAGTLIYLAAYATDNIVAALLLTLGIGFINMGLPAAWTLILQICPGRSVGAGAGMLNGIGNGFSALAPIIMGYFISTSGYVGGLLYLVGLACIGVFCMSILTWQKY